MATKSIIGAVGTGVLLCGASIVHAANFSFCAASIAATGSDYIVPDALIMSLILQPM